MLEQRGGPPAATGAGCAVGAPVAVGGMAIAAHGSLMAGTATSNLFREGSSSDKPGEVYVTEPQKESGKEYVGRTTQGTDKRMETRTDGRSGQAKTVDTYQTKAEGRYKEQKQIDARGGVKNLDNKRNEVSKDNMKKLEQKLGK